MYKHGTIVKVLRIPVGGGQVITKEVIMSEPVLDKPSDRLSVFGATAFVVPLVLALAHYLF